ncbi:hypothetical protein NDU88_000835 [Pleurodeles waltl]|uniref:Uncharacterized protein n=1 Tax=Pleurodeles waltl TaxID=8319 RepID=A0AAV7MLZ9_PLEWA|nr:hypothetical protein NDU88_000835 [Pleurodeles waltl]
MPDGPLQRGSMPEIGNCGRLRLFSFYVAVHLDLLSTGSTGACEEPRNPDPGRKCPGGTVNGIHADPEEEGVVKQRIREKDAEPTGVLNPEQDEGRRKSFFPGGEEVLKVESGTDRPAAEWKDGRRGRGGEALIKAEVEIAKDTREESRSKQTGHVLGRMWPSQVQATAENGSQGGGDLFL